MSVEMLTVYFGVIFAVIFKSYYYDVVLYYCRTHGPSEYGGE